MCLQGDLGKWSSQFVSLLLHSVWGDFPKDTALCTVFSPPYSGYLLGISFSVFSLLVTLSFSLGLCLVHCLLPLSTFCKNGVSNLEFLASHGTVHIWQLPVIQGLGGAVGNTSLKRVCTKMIQNGLQKQVLKL